MSAAIQDLIPGYVASRRGIVQKIANLKAEQEMIHHRLRLAFLETISEFPMWLHEEIEKYITADEHTRRDFLDTLVERMRYIEAMPAVDQMKITALEGAKREGQIRLDLTTWVSMRNSISFAIESMMKYTVDADVEDVDAIQREARSYEKHRIKPIDYIEDLAAPELSGDDEFTVGGLHGVPISERPSEDDEVTISILEFSKRQQEIMYLWINEGRSYSQIAEELGISKDSVAQHIDQARKKAMKLKEGRGIQQAFRDVVVEAQISSAGVRNKPQVVNGPKEREKIGEQLSIDDT